MRRSLLLASALCLGPWCHAQGQECGWRESPPDTLGARHGFQVECTPQGSSYAWDFGDGNRTVSTGPSVEHAYAAPGRLLRFDAVGKRLQGNLEVTPSARGMAVAGDGGRILVTRFLSGPEAGEIAEVDAATFRFHGSLGFPVPRRPGTLLFPACRPGPGWPGPDPAA